MISCLVIGSLNVKYHVSSIPCNKLFQISKSHMCISHLKLLLDMKVLHMESMSQLIVLLNKEPDHSLAYLIVFMLLY
jgi:hypothetical protein